MFNNINDNNRDFLYNSQFNETNNVINIAAARAAMQREKLAANPYVDKTEISAGAMKLFQRDLDINKFTKLVAEDPNDNSHLARMKELFDEGVIDVYEDDVLSSLVTNSKLLDDLGL
ncbi:hypothetical protein IJ750_03455 [bacterium]|nr:hypothetical protein [bacterium]